MADMKKQPVEDNRDIFEKALDYAPAAGAVATGALGAYMLRKGMRGRRMKVAGGPMTPEQKREMALGQAKAGLAQGKAAKGTDDAIAYGYVRSKLASSKPASTAGLPDVVRRRK